MKRIVLFGIAAILFGACCHNANTKLASQNDTLNWAIGVQTAQGIKGLKQMGVSVDEKIIVAAMQATLDGKEPRLSGEEYQMALDYINAVIKAGQKQAHEEAVKQATVGEKEFFERLPKENASVKKSDKGFYYEVLKEGNGPLCKERMVAVFDYSATTLDGTPYDATYGNRDAIVHVVGSPMFQGLIDGLCMMRAGSKYRFYFPHETCIGANAESPYSPMIYEVELHEVKEG